MNTNASASHDVTWTIAYRKRSASRFQRVQNLATTWAIASKIGDAFKLAHPELQVYVTPTRGHDEANPSHEDAFNILVDSGKRIRITEDAPDLGVEFLDMQPDFHATGGRNRVNGTLTLAPLGSLCQGHTPFSGTSFRCAGRDGLPSVAVHTWAPEGHSARNYCGYHSPYDLLDSDRVHLAASEAKFAEIDAANRPAPRDLPTEDEVFGNLPKRSRKPKVGDLVRYNGRLCLVRHVGSKWLRLADFSPFAIRLPRRVDRSLVTLA